MTDGTWVRACSVDELREGEGRVFRQAGQHVAIFRVGADEIYAVDNRCPHEGYPLSKGYVSGCVLTCPWHNFKFDLRDGKCVMGDEAVRTFPLRVVDRQVQVDITEPDPAEEIARRLVSLEQGLFEERPGQMARDIVRLLTLGMSAPRIALEAVRFENERAPYGSTHVIALANEVLGLARRFPGVDAVLPLMQLFEQTAENHVRRSRRPIPEPCDPGSDPVRAGHALRELVSDERVEDAEALLRGALARGWGRDVIEPWLFRLVADHFLDFGHGLIYQIKSFDLLDVLGWQHAPDVLPTFLLRIVNATREDSLPEWKWFRDATVTLHAELPAIFAGVDRRPLEGTRLFELLLDGDRVEMMKELIRELRDGVLLTDVVDTLSAAAAERLLRFDDRIDGDPRVQDGWLDVTHTLTFANALRHALTRFREPEVLLLVFYAARFINNAQSLDRPLERRGSLDTSASATIPAILGAIEARNPDEAAALAHRYFADSGNPAPLRVALEDRILADVATRPIVVTHLIKTTLAAFEELAQSRHPRASIAPVAVTRWLASPVRERSVGRLAYEAIRFVVHGKVPKTLT